MEENKIKERIRTDYKTFAGKPTIRDTRVAVEHVLGMLADGTSNEEILANYPFLQEEDIRACIMYAWLIISHEQIDSVYKSVG